MPKSLSPEEEKPPLLDTPNGTTAYMRNIGGAKLLTPDEEKRLAAQAKKPGKKGDEAKKTLVERNLRFVISIAKEYQNCGLEFDDLVSEGNIGLIKAVERFDPKEGAKLSTYSAWWIRQTIRRALSNQTRTIRLPVHQGDKIRRIQKVIAQLSIDLGREPTNEELQDETGLSLKGVKKLMDSRLTIVALDAPLSSTGDGTDTLQDILEDKSTARPDATSEAGSLKSALQDILEKLTPKEQEILNFRFGINGKEPETLEKVGARYKLTRERIRQIQDKALRKLRTRLSGHLKELKA